MKSSAGRKRAKIRGIWRRYSKNRLAVLGLFLVVIPAAFSVAAMLFSPYDPFDTSAESFLPPSVTHFFGTDDLGRDIFVQILFGIRISLSVGLLSVATASAIGLMIGSFSGYFGGKFDEILMRITEFFFVIPRLLLAIVLAAFLGSSFLVVVFIIGITSWTYVARVVRAEFLSLKELEFVEAAKAMGAGRLDIIFDEILANALSPVIVTATYQIGAAILVESSLAFLGLADPNIISLGYMLSMSNRFIFRSWWCPFFPGLMIFVLILGINLIGEGLGDALTVRAIR